MKIKEKEWEEYGKYFLGRDVEEMQQEYDEQRDEWQRLDEPQKRGEEE